MIVSELTAFVLFISTVCSCYKMEPYIAGGSYAMIEQFPHSVYLYIMCTAPESCGGSVLTQNVVLTAAHCFEDCVRNLDIIAYVGNANIEEMEIAEGIKNYLIHQKYDSKLLTNDIALGYIKSAWPLGKTIKRVMIAKNFPGVKWAKMAGWGVIDEVTRQQTSKLKMVSQIIQPKTTCKEAVKFEPGMMCAENNVKNYPSHGDSGSALVSGAGLQIGVVSFRSPKRMELVIYTNVSHYYDWITSHATTYMSEMEPYIVGGQFATIEQFPHSVYMHTVCYELSWMCGASILNQDIVLTAAHCLRVCQQDLAVSVFVGSHYVSQMPVGRRVSLYMLHETFDAVTSRDDIALVRTESALPLGHNIKRVVIASGFPGVKWAQIAGWGILEEGVPRKTDRLQWVWQPIRPGGDCNQFRLLPGMMCIRNSIYYRPSLGDSGSALMVNHVQQIGLVSFRHPHMMELVVYTNVSYYYDWIQQRTQQLRCVNK